MKYFLTETARKASGSTCYLEFQKGKHRGKFWLKDSLSIYADKFDEFEFYALFSGAIVDFDYCGITEIRKDQWENIVKESAKNETWNEMIGELTPWVDECFKKHKCFAICGL